ncbi:hypothetical protein B0H14DRAFT_3435688 [Mycena olivaceomarginata]|nr:hypothetical protein B0H14DRAFT_3435688 [Mycena olivaceomarginata]
MSISSELATFPTLQVSLVFWVSSKIASTVFRPGRPPNWFLDSGPLLSTKSDSHMSGSGVTYYNEELKMLLRLLKALPDTIPEGDLHDFRHYVLDPIKMKDIG